MNFRANFSEIAFDNFYIIICFLVGLMHETLSVNCMFGVAKSSNCCEIVVMFYV